MPVFFIPSPFSKVNVKYKLVSTDTEKIPHDLPSGDKASWLPEPEEHTC